MCEYCKDILTNNDKENMSLVELLSSKEFVLCGSYKDGYNQLKINYCPICGRDLNTIECEENEDEDDIYGDYDPYYLGWDV
jgi:hypothetical protein